MPACQWGGTTVGRASILSLVFLLSNALLLGQQQVIKQDADSASLTHVRSAGTVCPIGVEANLVALPSASNAAFEKRATTNSAQRAGAIRSPPLKGRSDRKAPLLAE